MVLNGTKAREPVTDGDLLSHRAMHRGVAEQFPGIDIVSEEKDEQSHSGPFEGDVSRPELPEGVPEEGDDLRVNMSDVVVWFDPLDATQE